MILDVLCIVAAIVARLIDNKNIYEKVQKVTVGRYLELQSKQDELGNEACEVFSDDVAVNNIFKSCQ